MNFIHSSIFQHDKLFVFIDAAIALTHCHLCLHFFCVPSYLHHLFGFSSKTVIRTFQFVSGPIFLQASCWRAKPTVTHSLDSSCETCLRPQVQRGLSFRQFVTTVSILKNMYITGPKGESTNHPLIWSPQWGEHKSKLFK